MMRGIDERVTPLRNKDGIQEARKSDCTWKRQLQKNLVAKPGQAFVFQLQL
jgi:hypothetical protein